jgi:hypothetical protein
MKTERLTKFITLAQLRNLGACVDQLEIFERTFGDSAEVSHENIPKALAAELDVAWIAWRALGGPAGAAYRAATTPAQAAFATANEEAGAALVAALVYARVSAYAPAVARAHQTYDTKRSSLRAPFYAAIASAFVTAYLSQIEMETHHV